MLRKYGSGSISDLIHVHKGRPAVVIGGAPCWPEDYKTVPYDAIYYSANDHGCKVVPCNYLVCCDDIGDRAHGHDIPVICRFPWADYRLYDIPLPNSGAMASWAAWVMGCEPIIIIGVECFTGKTYADNLEAPSSGFFKSKAEHLKRWSRLKDLCPNASFRPVSGPLLDIFPKYEPSDLRQQYRNDGRDFVESRCRGTRVEVMQDCTLNGRTYIAGTVREVDDIEERILHRRGQARLYRGG